MDPANAAKLEKLVTNINILEVKVQSFKYVLASDFPDEPIKKVLAIIEHFPFKHEVHTITDSNLSWIVSFNHQYFNYIHTLVRMLELKFDDVFISPYYEDKDEDKDKIYFYYLFEYPLTA